MARTGVPFKLYVPSVGVPVFVHETPARSVNPPADTVPYKQSIHVRMLLHRVLIEFTVDVARKLADDVTSSILYTPVPTFEILHRFMLRVPLIDVVPVTVRELRVVAFVTVRPLRVVSPCKEALAVTVRELRVVAFVTASERRVAVPPTDTLLVTVRELRVVVPAGTLNPPLETVTFPPVEGLKIILLLAVI